MKDSHRGSNLAVAFLEVEMDEHLGYAKNFVLGNNSDNSRNGYGKKQSLVITEKIKREIPKVYNNIQQDETNLE